MNETLNSVGMAGLGALLATTIFLAILVIFSARFFRWLKSAGFRFQDFEAHQDRNGVKLTSAFKRDGFEQTQQRGFTQPSGPAVPGVAKFGEQQPDQTYATYAPIEENKRRAALATKPYTVMVGIAAEKLKANDRVAVTEKAGYVRLATALETELGTIEHDANEGQQVNIRVPQGALLAEATN